MYVPEGDERVAAGGSWKVPRCQGAKEAETPSGLEDCSFFLAFRRSSHFICGVRRGRTGGQGVKTRAQPYMAQSHYLSLGSQYAICQARRV